MKRFLILLAALLAVAVSPSAALAQWEASPGAGIGGGVARSRGVPVGLVQIAPVVVLVTSQSTISFTNIPPICRDLVVAGQGVSTTAASSTIARMRFNADSGSNYQSQRTYSFTTNGAGQAAGETSATGTYFGDIAGPGANGGIATSFSYEIPNYSAATLKKQALGKYNLSVTGSPFQYDFNVSSLWNSTAAIYQVDLVMASGSWAAGSSFGLYGRGCSS